MTADPTQIAEKYEVVRKLGAGGMGAVYEARHRGTGRRVAIKLILGEGGWAPQTIARFQREARAAGAIDSEHITAVTDSGADGGSPYIVMELLDGEDFERIEQRLGSLRPDLALRVVSQALRGLERAHDAGVIHRDIKPANLFLARREGRLTVKICDFGIAKMSTGSLGDSKDLPLTQTSALLGSPRYMSPEQAKGAKNLDPRADIWSMGIVLYQLLSGDTPHPDADTLGLLLLAICSAPARSVQVPAPWVDKEIAAIVTRAIALDPKERYQTAREMREAIGALLPSGDAIDESMLTPLSGEERAFVAERPPELVRMLERTMPEGAAARVEEALRSELNAPTPSKTGGNFTRSRGDREPPRSRLGLGLGALAVAAAFGVGVTRLWPAREAPPAPAIAAPASAPEPLASSAPAVASSAPVAPSVAPEASSAPPKAPAPAASPRPHKPAPSASAAPSAAPSASSPSISREFN